MTSPTTDVDSVPVPCSIRTSCGHDGPGQAGALEIEGAHTAIPGILERLGTRSRGSSGLVSYNSRRLPTVVRTVEPPSAEDPPSTVMLPVFPSHCQCQSKSGRPSGNSRRAPEYSTRISQPSVSVNLQNTWPSLPGSPCKPSRSLARVKNQPASFPKRPRNTSGALVYRKV